MKFSNIKKKKLYRRKKKRAHIRENPHIFALRKLRQNSSLLDTQKWEMVPGIGAPEGADSDGGGKTGL